MEQNCHTSNPPMDIKIIKLVKLKHKLRHHLDQIVQKSLHCQRKAIMFLFLMDDTFIIKTVREQEILTQ